MTPGDEPIRIYPRVKMSFTPLVSFATRLVAVEPNATTAAPDDATGLPLSPSA
jgi:hypothetical protein